MNLRLVFLAVFGILLGCIPAQAELYLQQTKVLLKPRHDSSRCLDLDSTGLLIIWECHSQPNQLFTYVESDDTQIRIKDGCLIFNGRAGDQIGFGRCETNHPISHWIWRSSGSFQLRGSGLCIDVAGAGIQKGTPVIAYQCSGANNQRFRPVKTSPYTPPPPPPPPPEQGAKVNVELRPQHTHGMCLDFIANTRLVINRCNGSQTQKFTYGPGNSFWIRDGIGGCLGIVSGSTIGSQYCHSSSRNVKWELKNDGSFRNIGTNLCMDVVANRTSDGSQVAGYPCHGGANQRFLLKVKLMPMPPKPLPSPAPGPVPPPQDSPLGEPGLDQSGNQGRSIIPAHAQGMCADIVQATKRLVLWQCHGGANQKFNFRNWERGMIRSGELCLQLSPDAADIVLAGNCASDLARGWKRVRPGQFGHRRTPGRCLSAYGGGSANGTSLSMAPCQGLPHQRFTLR